MVVIINITQKFMVNSDCYRSGRTIAPKGIMVHSTATPGVMAADWFSRWNKAGINACVHAFLDDKGAYQYLPWNRRGWHAGGEANNTHVSFEICEPSGFRYINGRMVGYDVVAQTPYFNKAYNNAVEMCVYLCKMYNLTEKNILDHSEGYKKGIAANHGDVMHWFPLHGKSMDTLRADVKARLNAPVAAPSPTPLPEKAQSLEPSTVREVQSYLNIRISEGKIKMSKLSVDGSFGPLTKQALVRYWQSLVGKISIDGSFGTNSKERAKNFNLSQGDKGEIVRILQMLLICYGYKIKADGSFGPLTSDALYAYQVSRKLGADRDRKSVV